MFFNKEPAEQRRTFNIHWDLFAILKIKCHAIFVICLILIKSQTKKKSPVVVILVDGD
jgi:hypothetical protein